MQRVNPFALARRPNPARERTFTDPEQPGVELTLCLRRLDPAEATAALERAEELTLRYIGDAELKVEPEADFPAIGGRSVSVSARLFRNACHLAAMQSETDEEGQKVPYALYSAEELIAFCVTMPNAWPSILEFMAEVGAPVKNGSGAVTETSSESPSGTIGAIPRLTRRSYPSSGQLMSESEEPDPDLT